MYRSAKVISIFSQGPCKDFRLFGCRIQDENLGALVNCYFNALAKTSSEKAKTGRKHFESFVLETLGFNSIHSTTNHISLK